jgi:hypothetical protein
MDHRALHVLLSSDGVKNMEKRYNEFYLLREHVLPADARIMAVGSLINGMLVPSERPFRGGVFLGSHGDLLTELERRRIVAGYYIRRFTVVGLGLAGACLLALFALALINDLVRR